MPQLPAMGKEFYKSSFSTTAKFYIRQQAIGAIIRVLETAASRGVLCRMCKCSGGEVDLLLVPRLMAMNIDQPEAQLFFGMTNRQSCSKCRRRKGYSALRHGSFQERSEIRLLYTIYAQNEGDMKIRAAEKLVRRGFNPDRKCCLLSHGDALYVRTPKVTGGVEVFPGVDYRDKMHGMIMFLHKTLVKCLKQIKWVSRQSVSQESVLDQRLCQVVSSRALREPSSGHTYSPGTTIFSTADMSAKQKRACIFALPHAPTTPLVFSTTCQNLHDMLPRHGTPRRTSTTWYSTTYLHDTFYSIFCMSNVTHDVPPRHGGCRGGTSWGTSTMSWSTPCRGEHQPCRGEISILGCCHC